MKRLTARILSLILAVCLLVTAFAEIPDNSWVCSACGNTNAKAFCTNCGLKRPEAWTCIVCGEVNEAELLECRACGRNISGEWSCAMCGAANTKDNIFCGRCGKAIGTKPEAPEAEVSYNWDDFEFETLEDGTLCLTKYTGSDAELIIPGKRDGVAVTGIGERAFWGCSNLTSVTIPDSVTSIGNYAFFNCSSLTSVTIPDSVTSIGLQAFSYCRSLTSVTIPDSVTSIGDYAFSSCSSLTNVTIPDSVKQMGINPFWGCESLTTIDVSPTNTVFETIDGVLFNKQSKTLICYPITKEQTSYAIPDGVESIGEMAFYYCDSLTSVTIPDSVTSIGDWAFYCFSSLTSVTIPDSVTSIGDYAFYSCSSLTSVTIPDGVTSIYKYTFDGCRSLTSVTIPDSVTSIGYSAFSSCSSLTSVTIPDSVTSISDYAFYGCPNLTITATSRSYAEKYAKENNIPVSAPASAVEVGSYVKYGRYPQNAAGTDNTPIEWLVLDVQNNKALLISRYGLDAQPYNKDYVSITWEKCTLRTWLNSTFLNKAFSAEEQKAILTTAVDNSKSQCYSGWSTSGGNNTQDKIFLLSYAEANKYFGVTYTDYNNTKSRVEPTAYAIKNGAYTRSSHTTADGKAAGWWWLRSPGYRQNYAALVYIAGSLTGSDVSSSSGSVRPAFWINLKSVIF